MEIILEKFRELMAWNIAIGIISVVVQTLFIIVHRFIYKLLSYSRILMSKQDKDLEKCNLGLSEIKELLLEIKGDRYDEKRRVDL